MTPLVPEWLGRVPYRESLARQRSRREAVIEGAAPEAFWLLEHDPVLTTGRRPVPGADGLAALGCEVVATERGGLATFHGPGQLVGYLILDLGRRGHGIRAMITGLEQGILAWLRGRGVPAERRPGFPGVWIGPDKVCAVGMHFRRGVSMHGFALNLRTDLSWFGRFTPCGITDGGVTSLERWAGASPPPVAVALEVGEAVRAALEGISR